MYRFIFSLIFILEALCLNAQVFDSDAERQQVMADFQQRQELMGRELFNYSQATVSQEEMDAMHFLYAYMPLADLTDYPSDFYLRQVRSTLQSQAELPWAKSVPTLLFRHFVLPLRVNNENLDEARIVLFHELKDRVKHLSMAEAILEVNHWCHEHVTYQPSDARTLSPLACMKNALGRCGEESIFTVAALRSVGIPARQVYTPRWAHTDDNHAWVEAWADGQWYFLGACEPEPVLNLGWFNQPASRAMLMHTRAFGRYEGPEEVVLRTNNFTEINLINNYADTERIDFRIVDEKGLPAKNAKVEFKIYNYAEFYTAVTKYTDSDGRTFLTAGLGDLLVWASKDGRYGYRKASFGSDKELEIVLTADEKPAMQMDIHPPVGKNNLPAVTEAKQQENKLRLQREDSIRKAYEQTFFNAETNTEILKELVPYLQKARGNWQTILRFYNDYTAQSERVLHLLESLSTKDLRDIDRQILDDVMLSSSNELCPRVEDEMLIRPFRKTIEQLFTEKEKTAFRKQPQRLADFIVEKIRLNPDTKALRIAQTPSGALEYKMTDTRSRDILFVDIARTLGIKARKDVVTKKVQYEKEGRWMDIHFDKQKTNQPRQGRLQLTFTPTKYVDDARYYSHFTISRIDDGRPVLLSYDEGEVDMGGGTSWNNTFKQGVDLDEGRYLLVTGTRLANGSVLSTTQEFVVEAGKTTTLPLTLRQSDTEVSVIGSFDSESKFEKDSQQVSILSQTGRGYFVVGIVGMGQEPTNHTLHDIAKMKSELDAWGRPLILLFENETELQRFNTADYGKLPVNTLLGIDTNGDIGRQIATQMRLESTSQLPIFIIADTFNRVVFCSQGYTIGLGEQLLKTIRGLQ